MAERKKESFREVFNSSLKNIRVFLGNRKKKSRKTYKNLFFQKIKSIVRGGGRGATYLDFFFCQNRVFGKQIFRNPLRWDLIPWCVAACVCACDVQIDLHSHFGSKTQPIFSDTARIRTLSSSSFRTLLRVAAGVGSRSRRACSGGKRREELIPRPWHTRKEKEKEKEGASS